MRSFCSYATAVILFFAGLSTTASAQSVEQKGAWMDSTLGTKRDAIKVIKETYEEFTTFINKIDPKSGICDRKIRTNGCEMVIENIYRKQGLRTDITDHYLYKKVTVIYLDQVKLEGNMLTPIDPRKGYGIYEGPNTNNLKHIPSFDIFSNVTDKQEDFTREHYDDHIKWSYEFLLALCSGKHW